MYFFLKKMRRSRSLTFKKEQEQPQPQRQQPPKLKSSPPQLNRPQQTKINYQSQSYEVEDSDNDDVPLSKVSHSSKQPPKKQTPPKRVEDEEEENDYEDEEHYDQEEDEEEEKLPPPPKVVRPSTAKPKQAINLSTQKDQKDQEEQPSPSKQRGRSPGRKPTTTVAPTTSPKSRSAQQEQEEPQDQDEEEVRESKEGNGDKRKRLILSKTLFQKFLTTCEIESTTSDIINHTEADLIEYVQDVVKVISNNEEDDEVVVRDSSLKFLGDKSKAQGLLDQKTFDKIFQEAIANVSTNITFTSEAYKSLCKYTEVHVLDMLTKVKAIMKHSGRKRLNTSDVELLKFILE
jgi:histone H3/H4